MKKYIFLYSMMIMLITACSKDEEILVVEEQPVSTRSMMAYSGETEGVSVLVFSWDTNNYYYGKSLHPVWVNNKTSTNLELGKYTFLFYKSDNVNTKITPENPNSSTKMEDIKFQAIPDPAPSRTDYVLPVEEIWLQETADLIKTAYTISGTENELVQAELTRAVSQLELTVKRGYESGDTFVELPFEDDESILNIVEKITCDIKNVGSAIDLNGGLGSVNTYFQNTESGTLLEKGFAHFTGPFIFPNGSKTASQIDITVTPVANSNYPEMKTSVSGMFERNKKLNVTLWLTATYELIYVSINTEPMSEETEGDSGIWD